jgi:hypothetical protein
MPAAAFADLYAATWDFWQAGQRQEAMETRELFKQVYAAMEE